MKDKVAEFATDVTNKYLMYIRSRKEFKKIVYQYRKDRVCFLEDGVLQPVTSNDVFRSIYMAERVFDKLSLVRSDDKIFPIRHKSDWYTAATIEEFVLVNRLGFGVFKKK